MVLRKPAEKAAEREKTYKRSDSQIATVKCTNLTIFNRTKGL